MAAAAGLAICLTGCDPSSVYDAQQSQALSEPVSGDVGEAKRLAAEANAASAANTTGTPNYRIGTQDVLEIVVFKVPDLSRTIQVGDSGSINLPLVGEIPAVGRTAQELERDLTKRLDAKYLNKPQVNVYIREFNSQRVTVSGAVKQPGIVALRGRTTLMQALSMTQGIDRDYASNIVTLLRNNGGQRRDIQIDVDAVTSGQAPDVELQAGDVIVVPTSGTKVAFQNFLKLAPVAGTLRPSY